MVHAVDPHAVRAFQIHGIILIALADDARVVAGNGLVLDDDVVLRRASNDQRGTVEDELTPRHEPADDDEARRRRNRLWLRSFVGQAVQRNCGLRFKGVAHLGLLRRGPSPRRGRGGGRAGDRMRSRGGAYGCAGSILFDGHPVVADEDDVTALERGGLRNRRAIELGAVVAGEILEQ